MVKEQHRAQRLFAELLASTEAANKAVHDEWLETAMTYKANWEDELHRRDRLGIADLPPPLPLPDHVIVDLHYGTVRIAGPATPEEKAEHDRWLERRRAFQAELEELKIELDAATDPAMRNAITADIEHTHTRCSASWPGRSRPALTGPDRPVQGNPALTWRIEAAWRAWAWRCSDVPVP